MKCIKHITDGRIDRCSDEDAARLVAQKWWQYCRKSEWKKEHQPWVKSSANNAPD
jgi:hypothetical protein